MREGGEGADLRTSSAFKSIKPEGEDDGLMEYELDPRE